MSVPVASVLPLDREPRRSASVYSTTTTSTYGAATSGVGAVSEEEKNALFEALARKNDTEAVTRLIQACKFKSVLTNAVSPAPLDFGRTPLHLVVLSFPAAADELVDAADAAAKDTRTQQVQLLHLLLESGADVNAVDQLEETPFSMAVADGKTRLVAEFLAVAERVHKFGTVGGRRHRSTVPDLRLLNRNGENVFFAACERGAVPIVKLLLSFARLLDETALKANTSMDTNTTTTTNNSHPTGVPAAAPPAALLPALLNHLNHSHETPLLQLVERGGDDAGHVEVVRLLLAEKHRADHKKEKEAENTVAGGHHENNNKKCVMDLSIQDAEGNDALTLARRYHLKRIVALLEKEPKS